MSRFHNLEDPETLRLLVRNLAEGIYITNARGDILDANPAFVEICGYSSLAELRSHQVKDLLADPATRAVQQEVLAHDGKVRDFELEIRRPDGEVRTVVDTCFLLRDPETGEDLCHGILVDITSRKQLERQLQEMSVRDPLTGCYNRRQLGHLGGLLDRSDREWGVIVLDIDNFKAYNDLHGHKRGDETLVDVARFLLRNARSEDSVIRLGGDEFAVLLVADDGLDPAVVARRLKAAAVESEIPPFTLGWAVRSEGESLEQTLGRADRGLLEARARERRWHDRRRARRG